MDLVVGASSNAVKSLVGKLGSLLAQEYTLIQGVRDDIQFINDELASMQAFLIKTKRADSHDEQRHDWMKQVREVSYDIEDCVDDVNHRLGDEPRGTGKIMYIRKKWYLVTTLYSRHCIATEIRNLKVRAQHVSDRRTRYGVENPPNDPAKSAGSKAPTDRVAPPPELIGTKKPVGVEDAIKELGGWYDRGIRFLAISGFGGLGKTTLALELYRKFANEFPCRAIVQVSQKFNIEILLRSLLKQFHEQQVSASQDFLDGIEDWDETELKLKLVELVEQAEIDDRDETKLKLKLVELVEQAKIEDWDETKLKLKLAELIEQAEIDDRDETMLKLKLVELVEQAEIEDWDKTKLKQMLDNQVKKYRYLILLDDIWSVSAWEKISESLPRNGRVIVTTRFKSVAVACCRQNGASHDHKKLDKKKSYDLFCQIIPSALEDASNGAEDLLEKCGGLPLAIIVVAGLVASKLRSGHTTEKTLKLEDHLKEVAEALIGGLETNLTTDGVKEILDKCYNDMPADLKTCLLYLSMFPKGSFISRKRLIRRWITEGFVIEKHGKTINEVAEDYFNELIDRNLIRAVRSSSNGKVKDYQIHDMVLEYIISKSSDENFITVVGCHWQTPFPSYKVRRLSVHRSVRQERKTVERMKLSHVRSLSAFESIRSLHSCLHNFQILQVLDLEGCKDLTSHLLKKICKMHQLKYLSLRKTDIVEVPSEIGRLVYLEVLDIRETEVEELPSSVGSLERITHLLTGSKSKRKALILTEEITKMTALQTLSGMGIRGSSTAGMIRSTKRTSTCKDLLQALQKLTNLKKLSLYILDKLDADEEVSLLSTIEHLTSCSLKFLAIDDGISGFLSNSFSLSKAPPEHLHALELSGMLSKVPDWIGGLHNLEKLILSLTSFTQDTLLVLGKLPLLFSLTFSLDSKSNTSSVLRILHNNTLKSRGEIPVLAGGFEKLKLLRFLAPVLPPLSFLKQAMPALERLEMRFRTAEGVHGLENLARLRQVILTVSTKASKVTIGEIKRLAKIANNATTVTVNEYNESSAEQ